MNNPITQKSIRFLAQPYTLLVLVIYAINEFILQRHFPSWLSGKLSDFAWMFIAPVILTLLFSLLLSSRWQQKPNTAPILAYILTSLFFTAIKTIPAANAFLLQSWLTIFHYPAAVVMDATDLLALLVLPVSWTLWQNKKMNLKNSVYQTALIISLFALLTLADAQMYDPDSYEAGIYNLFQYEDLIIAQSSKSIYCSQDGGYTWDSCPFTEDENEIISQKKSEFKSQIDIPKTQIKYRINEIKLIQVSMDSGNTWEYISFEPNLSNPEVYYLEHYHPYGFFPSGDGGNILYDSKSGNTIFTMGIYGVIIVDQCSNFTPVAIKQFVPLKSTTESLFTILIAPYILPSILIIILLFGIHMIGYKGIWYRILIALGFGVWFLSFHPQDGFSLTPYTYDLEVGLTIFSIFIINLLLLVFSFNEFLTQRKNIKSKWHVPILGSLLAGPLFFLTFCLWFKEVIPSRNLTVVISYSIIGLFIVYAIYQSYKLKKSLGTPHE
jgi:hypothetical protein